MSHLKQHSIVSTEDHDLSGISQGGLIMVNPENGGSITTVTVEEIACNLKKVVYSGTLNASLFASWENGQQGIAQKNDGSEVFYCYKQNNYTYAVEMTDIGVTGNAGDASNSNSGSGSVQ